MTWEYRVMNCSGEPAICEVYYRADGTVEGHSAEITCPAAVRLMRYAKIVINI